MTIEETKHESDQKQGGEAAVELLPNESYTTANVSFLAHEQKLTTAALKDHTSVTTCHCLLSTSAA